LALSRTEPLDNAAADLAIIPHTSPGLKGVLVERHLKEQTQPPRNRYEEISPYELHAR
jgi:hypothetical protein